MYRLVEQKRISTNVFFQSLTFIVSCYSSLRIRKTVNTDDINFLFESEKQLALSLSIHILLETIFAACTLMQMCTREQKKRLNLKRDL